MSHSTVNVERSNIYLAGLHPVEESFVWEEFQRHAIPGWGLAVLESNKKFPADLTSGKAILVIGCANARPLNHTETLRRLKLFMYARVWIAVAFDPQRITQDLCEAAGASGYFARPINTGQLRETIQNAIPQMGNSAKRPFSCAQIVYLCQMFRSNVYLRLQTQDGLSGFVAIRHGQPCHAQLSNGCDGLLALHTILSWGSAKVFCLPVPDDIVPNLPNQGEAIATSAVETEATAANEFTPFEMASGGTIICDRLTQTITNVQYAVVVDTKHKRVVGCPSLEELTADDEQALVQATLGLIQVPGDESSVVEQRISDVVLTARDGWCAAFVLGIGSFVVVVSAWGPSQSVLARSVILEAIRDGVLAENNEQAKPSVHQPVQVARPTCTTRERETIYQ